MEVRSINKLLGILLAAAFCNLPAIIAQELKSESRMQAVLKLKGDFLQNGEGMIITEAPATGPGANLDLPNAPTATRGILEKGDVIVEIEGKRFRDRREFLDLMNDAHRKNGGKVRITVKDFSTGRLVIWISRPEMARMDVPPSTISSIDSNSWQPKDKSEAEVGAPPKSASSLTILSDKFAL